MSTYTLHPFQAAAIDSLRASRIHLALTAPTGSGKGVILEVLAEDRSERVLLFTPLVALGRQLKSRFAMRCSGERVWVISPESALARRKEVLAWRPTLVAVDEAHCLQEWGRRFRPAYGRVLEFVRSLGCPRTLWMSATFPRLLLSELQSTLPGSWHTHGRFRMPAGLETRFERVSAADRVERVRRSVLSRVRPGLLFAGTRKEVGRYYSILTGERPVLPYHAGMSDEERRSVESLLGEEARSPFPRTSVIATNAFGMGMDFPQFEWTLLAQTPFSLLGLMQSFGRVARGNHTGFAEIYWAEEDFRFAGLLLSGGSDGTLANRNLALLREYLEASPQGREEIVRSEFL